MPNFASTDLAAPAKKQCCSKDDSDLSSDLSEVEWDATSSTSSVLLGESHELPWLGELAFVLETPPGILYPDRAVSAG